MKFISYLAKSRAIKSHRDVDGWVQNGDEEFNEDIEESSIHTNLVSMPLKLKAVIKFGYDDGLKTRLGNETFEDWIKDVFVHTRAHFKHPSLGTEVEFEVLCQQS